MARNSRKRKGRSAAAEVRANSSPLETPRVEEPQEVSPPSSVLLTQIAVLVLAALFIYWPALHGSWLWDDDSEIQHNLDSRSLAGLLRIWMLPPATDYWPLSWTVLWVEWHLWSDHVLGYHIVNVALHVASGLLIWRLLAQLGLRWAWLGGFTFVIHPLAVESVAWMSEIKNTLSLPLLLLSMNAWLAFDRTGRTSPWLQSITFYLAAMLAKTSVVMLPAVLLLHCWWKRGRIAWRDLARVLPYAAIAAVLGWITVRYQGARTLEMSPPEEHLLATLTCAGKIVLFYLGKFLVPVGLLPVYPVWQTYEISWEQAIAVPLLGALFLLLWISHANGSRHVILGLGFFVLNLSPVLGFFRMSFMSLTPVSDHLAYLPIVGLAGLAALGAQELCRWAGRKWQPWSLAATAVIAVALLLLSHAYAAWFESQETLWTRTLQRNPNAAPAYLALGIVHGENGDLDGAVAYLRQGEALAPRHDGIAADLGHALFLQGHFQEAKEQLDRATALNPRRSSPYFDRGALGLVDGRPEVVESNLREFLRLAPEDDNVPYAHLWLRIAEMKMNNRPAAQSELDSVLASGSDHEAGAWVQQIARYFQGETDQGQLLTAASAPDDKTSKHQYCEAWYYLGIEAELDGNRTTAIEDFQHCAALDCPDMVESVLAQAELNRAASKR